MKKLLSVFFATIIVVSIVTLGIQKPIIAKAEETQIKAFINNTVNLIQKNDFGKDYISENESQEVLSSSAISVDETEKPKDTAFQTCRLIVKSDNSIDTLNSIGIASGFLNYHIVQFANAIDTENAFYEYLNDENIISVSPDKVHSIALNFTMSETVVPTEETTIPERLNSWGSEITGLYDVKDYIKANHSNLNEIVVGVIDSGIHLEHKFFSDRIVRTHFNSANDGEANNESIVSVGTSHGTMVSSVIVDSTPENIKVANYRILNVNDQTTDTAVVAAFLAAINDGVDIINASFSVFDESGIVQDAINEAHKADIPVVSAAGNETMYIETDSWSLPASDKNVISVCSLSENGLPSAFTSYSHSADIVAPGENINIAYGKDGFGSTSGTSFSAPLVSSLFAVLKTLYPNCNNKEFERRIESTAKHTDLIAETDLFGYGTIDAIAACGFERTETPEINIDSGNYIGEISVELKVPEGCSVYYTLDGSYPTKENSILYNEPINLSNDILFLKAVAYSNDSFKSECAKRFYRLQTLGTDEMFTISDDGNITSYLSKGINDLIIPDSINSISVTGFDENVFSESDFIGVTLPSTLETLSAKSFYDNDNIMFADGESIKIIERYSFYSCDNLYCVDFPKTEYIEQSAFCSTITLSELYLEKCKTIEKNAFQDCYSLRSVYTPSLEILGADAFRNCIMLAEIYVPELKELSLRAKIYGNQFIGCELYKELDLPKVESVPTTTFNSTSNYSFISKLEFSKVKDIKSLPKGVSEYLNKTVTLILPSTLESCTDSVLKEASPHWYKVYGTAGTYAEHWAAEYGFEFITISEENKEAAIITDLPEHYYSYMRPLEADVAGFNRTYQWYGSNSDNSTSGIAIEGATEKKFNPNDYKQYKYYYCVVTSTDIGYEPIEIKTGITENKSYILAEDPEKELADYSAVEAAKSKADEINRELYTPESLAKLDEAIAAIDYNLTIDKQSQVEEIAKAIEKAISELEYKSADYSAIEEAKSKADEIDRFLYTAETLAKLDEALSAVDYNLTIDNQTQVEEFANAIEKAISELEYKSADYSTVEKALAQVPSDLSIYTEESVLELRAVVDDIDYSLNITQQKQVDEYAEKVNKAVENLEEECWLIRFFEMIIVFFEQIIKNVKLCLVNNKGV